MQQQDVFIDKIKLGAIIIEKELLVIQQFNNIVSDLRRGAIDHDRLNEYPPYFWCLSNMSELYDFLKNDYIDKIPDADQKAINLTFNNYVLGNDISFEEFIKAKELLLLIMSKSKFHNILRFSGPIGLKGVEKKLGI